MLRIHVYTMAWNEEMFLPYFLRHYTSFAERIVVFDNGSDDRTVEVARSFPRTAVGSYDSAGLMDEAGRARMKSQMWKESRGKADFVIVVDCDELVWHPQLLDMLELYKVQGITLTRCQGYEMIADSFPRTSGQVYDVAKRGVRAKEYDKPCLFDPNAIEEINYTVGGHGAKPRGGNVILPAQWELYLLHYRMLGLDYVRSRFRERAARQPADYVARNWNAQYRQSDEELTRWFANTHAAAVEVLR